MHTVFKMLHVWKAMQPDQLLWSCLKQLEYHAAKKGGTSHVNFFATTIGEDIKSVVSTNIALFLITKLQSPRCTRPILLMNQVTHVTTVFLI